MKSRLIRLQANEAKMNIEQFNEKVYLRSVDVMQLFSISESTLKNLRTSGELPCYKLGKSRIYLYKREEIEALLTKLIGSNED